jgi:hypothetical protein
MTIQRSGDPSPEFLNVPEWDEAWNQETLALAYEASRGTREAMAAWADALDTKLFGVFAVGGIILTLAPTLQAPSKERVVVACWFAAALLWLFALILGYQGYAPTILRAGPNPQTFLEPVWMKKSPRDFHLAQLVALADSFRHNHATLKRKAEALGSALAVTAVEILILAAAIVLSSRSG